MKDLDTQTEKPWHHITSADVINLLGSDIKTGLDQQNAKQRLQRYGPNSLPIAKRRSALKRFATQFHNPLIYVLLCAGLVTVWVQHYADSIVIFGVVMINAIIGFIQEGKAEHALEAVRSLLARRATVLREGIRHEINAADLVPGDVVLLESGSRVPADLRLLRTKNLQINESALTGESVPAEKNSDIVETSASIADRTNIAYSGTVVTYGQAQGVVIATGLLTEIGRIGVLVAGVENLTTPLMRRLDQFAREITVFVLILALATFLYGHYAGQMPVIDIFLTVVGLSVSAIPEGLPAIVTITLAIGTRLMAHQNAIVRRLPAVETLGSVTVICTDKTGTLTKNEMTVVSLILIDEKIEVSGSGYAPEGGFTRDEKNIDPSLHNTIQQLARCAMLCNDARLHHDEKDGWILTGDPTEGALLSFALKAGMDIHTEFTSMPRIDEIPFESEHRYMATLHHDHKGHEFVYIKGAPERLLELCTTDINGNAIDINQWESCIHEAAQQGQRVLALARCDMPAGTTALSIDDINKRFTLLGMVGMIDPPREESITAINECRQAGIRVVMITGDHVVTAAAIGKLLGLNINSPLTGDEIENLNDDELANRLAQTDIIARASPEDKLRLVSVLQSQGELVAMTGDGVNDAPALKTADIGVAMGERGTDAAKEAAHIVLTDDNFSTITKAVREGRVVFDNIKKSLLFILPTNGGESGVILLAVIAGLAMPVTPGQILWINMVTTVTLALALAFEQAEANVMRRKPRPPAEPMIINVLLLRIIYVSLLMITVAFIVYEWELSRGSSVETARTAVVNMLVIGELVYLFNVRFFTDYALTRETWLGNPIALWASLVLVLLQLIFTYSLPMQSMFHTTALDIQSWTLIVGLGVLKFFAVELEKWILRRVGIQRI